jgi:hypothetical protein
MAEINSKANPSRFQLFLKIMQKLSLTAGGQHSFPLLYSQLDYVICRHAVVIDEPGADDKQGSTSSSVAVDADFSSVSQTHLKDVHDVHHVSKRS